MYNVKVGLKKQMSDDELSMLSYFSLSLLVFSYYYFVIFDIYIEN